MMKAASTTCDGSKVSSVENSLAEEVSTDVEIRFDCSLDDQKSVVGHRRIQGGAIYRQKL